MNDKDRLCIVAAILLSGMLSGGWDVTMATGKAKELAEKIVFG